MLYSDTVNRYTYVVLNVVYPQQSEIRLYFL